MFVGQAAGPFLLNCHLDPDYPDDPRSPEILQCAGAAVFRSNMEFDKRLPVGLLSLPPNTQAVFASPSELVAHHSQCSVLEAEQFMALNPVDSLLNAELSKSGVRRVRKL